MKNFDDVCYESKERVATITLNRPERFNVISETRPDDIAAAFEHASDDDAVHVVVLTGAGRGFCGGYNLKAYAEKAGENPAVQDMPWDPMVNQAYENMGLASTQILATVFDGIARHSPEGVWFRERAETLGFKQAVAERDSGEPIPGSKR